MSIAEDILSQAGALKTDGHYVYASGRHGNAYINKKAVLDNKSYLNLLALEIAHRFELDDIGVVIGPESGGAIIAVYVARHLKVLSGQEVTSATASKTRKGDIELDGDNLYRARFRRALIVDDILTTGGSLQKTIQASKIIGCRVIAACVLVNRGGVTANHIECDTGVRNLHLDALVSTNLESWPADECPLCKDGVPINTDLGHGTLPK